MRCTSCGHENQIGAHFCEACGSSLGLRCDACGAEVGGGASFCSACGHRLKGPVEASAPTDPHALLPEELASKISSSREALAGEHKQVTVLFCDVVGSMKLSERADPEQWQGIMDRFFAILSAGIHRFEGTVDKFTGDGVMAIFGAPIAHEDHAARACHAALHLREELAPFSAELRRESGINFSVRIGLNSGEVVVGSIGEDLAMNYTAIGHTVGLAQRMEALAEPGEAYLTEYTAALVEGYFELTDLGQFKVEGVAEPLRVYELAGLGRLRTRLELSRAHGLARFVGREEETATLEAALVHADEGNGQVISVVGEAGVGKSRLCYEFAERCRERGIDVWEGHCKARGETLPLLPLLELLRSYFGITSHDTGQTAREKIAGRVMLLDEALRDELPLLFDLLGVSDPERPLPQIDPEARQRRLFSTFNRFLQARSERSVAVYLIEDLQWIDPASGAFLQNLIDAVPNTRTLVVVNFRPEYQAEWMRRSYCSRLALAPLGPDACEGLIRELLGTDPSLEGLSEQIRERAGGNPFFIEELVRGLVEGGNLRGTGGDYRQARPIDGEAIPATVQAVIAGRIDRLTARDKKVLQTAAVIGREFEESVLRRVVAMPEPELKGALRALLDAELVAGRSLAPERVYAFHHQLIEEVAYGTQLAEARKALHGATARALEELNPDRLDELAATISRHLEQAGEQLEAARWAARAAAWAGFADPYESLRHWRRVVELTDSVPDEAEAVAMGTWARISVMSLGWRLGTSEEEIRVAFEESRELANRKGDANALAFGLGMYAHTRVMAGDAENHVEMMREAHRLGQKSGNPMLKVPPAGVPWALFVTGRLREALKVMEPGFALWEKDPSLGSGLGVQCPYAFATWLSARIGATIGEITIEQAREESERALTLAIEHADVENECWAHTSQVWLCWLEGSGEQALEHGTRAVEIGERTAGSFLRGNAYGWRALAHTVRGDWREAIADFERAREILREGRSDLTIVPLQFAYAAVACLHTGEGNRAREIAQETVDMAVRSGTRYFELGAQLALARVLAESQGLAAGAAIGDALTRAAALIDQTGATAYRPLALVERARLAELDGDTDRAEREIRAARELFEAIGATGRARSLAGRAALPDSANQAA